MLIAEPQLIVSAEKNLVVKLFEYFKGKFWLSNTVFNMELMANTLIPRFMMNETPIIFLKYRVGHKSYDPSSQHSINLTLVVILTCPLYFLRLSLCNVKVSSSLKEILVD